MDPRTAENRRTYDAVAPLYDGRQSDELYPVAVEPFDRLCSALEPGALVADLGCGPGRQLPQLQARGFEVLGVDLSERPGAPAALLLASGSSEAHEPVPYAPKHARWFFVRGLDRVRELAAGAGLDVLWSDVVPEEKRSPVRLLVRPSD